MKSIIEYAFPRIVVDGCLETTAKSEFGILDRKAEKCIIQHYEGGKIHFIVLNPNQKPIHFLAIDHCLFSDNLPKTENHQRCDCAIFDETTFCFIEIKDVVFSQKSKESRDAKNQLLDTIDIFQNKIDFKGKRLEAYVCVGITKEKPVEKAMDLEEQIEFRRRKVQLFKNGYQKTFN